MRFGGEVDGAAEGVEDAAVLVDAAELAELFVKAPGVAAAKGRDAMDAEVVEVLREAGADAGDALEVCELGGWGLGSSHGGAKYTRCWRLGRVECRALQDDAKPSS